jgi:orotidine-5'-phosphate decarboxylase
MTQQDATERIIIALDVENKAKALRLVDQLKAARIFKIGLRLFTAEGPLFLQEITARGKEVFLDLKFHDIPNTVAQAVKVCVGYGVQMMTMHAAGGSEMMGRAAEAASEESARMGIPKPILLAVTVLTSMKAEALKEIGMPPDPEGQVTRLARMAKKSGAGGIVCSPREIKVVKDAVGGERDFPVVTPGIRPSWAAADDQKRILTPAEAVKIGADYLVIGRPVIAAPSPEEAFQKILDELAGRM